MIPAEHFDCPYCGLDCVVDESAVAHKRPVCRQWETSPRSEIVKLVNEKAGKQLLEVDGDA